jgi:hypothetical protein
MRFGRALLLLVALLLSSFALGAAPVTVLDDHDWRPAAAVARADGVARDMTPELLLRTEFKEPVFLFDPTDDETVTYITDFQGKLYLAACTQPADTDTGSVFTYDPDTHQWQKVFQVNDQGLVRLEVCGDRMYIAGYDANDGGWDLGNVYVYDGKTWVEHRTVPRAIHEYGLAVYHNRLYVSADILDPPPPGKEIAEAADKGEIDVYGRVVSSGDGGLTWREEYRGPTPGQDVGFMTVWHDRLILNARGDLLTFDGKRWRELGLNPAALVVFDYVDAGDVLLLATSLGLAAYDGAHAEFRHGFPITQARAITRFGSSWVVVQDAITGGTIGHGPGMMSYPLHAAKDRRPFCAGLCVIADASTQHRGGGATALEAWWKHSRAVMSDELLTTAHAFRGRLYLGTHPKGRVLVLPVVKEGALDAAPRPVGAGAYTLSWEAATPVGTSVRLQVRTAATREALERQPFAGPDETAATTFDTPGATLKVAAPGFLQYRVLLKTDNPALTPYLKRVTLRGGE